MGAVETNAMLDLLRATGLPVGDGRKPDGAGWQGGAGQSAFATYLVLYPVGAARQGPEAPLADWLAAPQWEFQVSSVGRDRRSAETASDIAAQALLNAPVTLTLAPGWVVVQIVHTTAAGVTADESVNPPLFTGVDRYRLDTGPA